MPVTNIKSAMLPRMMPRISVLVIRDGTARVGKGPSIRRESANPSATVSLAVTETQPRLSGRRMVLFLYAVIVGIAGVLGLILGTILPLENGLELFFLIPLPPTPLGLATFGVVTVAVGLGIPLALVIYLSRRVVTAPT